MKQQLTETQWFLAVSGKKASFPDDPLLMCLLGGLGCREIEPLGHGTAQARIPAEWADAVERNGFYAGTVTTGADEWTVDIDLP